MAETTITATAVAIWAGELATTLVAVVAAMVSGQVGYVVDAFAHGAIVDGLDGYGYGDDEEADDEDND